MFKCPISHREGWRKKKVLVQAQIQPSQAAEFSSKAGKRWTGTAAEGAAASLERAHAVCRDGSTALLLCPTARAARGDVCQMRTHLALPTAPSAVRLSVLTASLL